MVKIVAILLYQIRSDVEPVLLKSHDDLTDFNYFTRGSIREYLYSGTKIIATRIPSGIRECTKLRTKEIKDSKYLAHVYVQHNGVAGVVITDDEYPSRIAFSLLTKVLQHPDILLSSLMTQYQNPTEVDKLARIQQQLEDIKIVMHENIEEVLKRGESLDDLIRRSSDLSATSKIFYGKARDTNKCCVIL